VPKVYAGLNIAPIARRHGAGERLIVAGRGTSRRRRRGTVVSDRTA
jgi:hypothetical protein